MRKTRTTNNALPQRSAQRREDTPQRSQHDQDCAKIDDILRKERQRTKDTLRMGKLLARIKETESYRDKGFNDFGSFTLARFGFGAEWANSLIKVAKVITPEQVQGKPFCRTAMVTIANEPQERYRALLLKHGSFRKVSVLEAALGAAHRWTTVEQGEQALLAELGLGQPPTAPAPDPEPDKPPRPRSVVQCLADIKKSSGVIVGRIDQLIDHQANGEVDEDDLDTLRKVIKDLNATAAKLLGPPEPGPGGGQPQGDDSGHDGEESDDDDDDDDDDEDDEAGEDDDDSGQDDDSSQDEVSKDNQTTAEPGPAADANPAPAPDTQATAQAAPEPAPYQPPDRPFVDQGEGVLAVYAHPSCIHDMTRAEHLCYRFFTFAASLTILLTDWLHLRLVVHEESVLELLRRAAEESEVTLELLKPFIPLLEPAIARAQAAEPPDPAEPEEPEEPADLLLEWVLYYNFDPLDEPDPNQSDMILWSVLGQLPILNKDLAELTALREQGGDQAGIDVCLLRRFGQMLPPFQHLITKSWGNLARGARPAYQFLEAEQAHFAALEAARGPRESRIVVVGADALPPAHGFIGKTLDHRLVTFSFWEPSLTLVLGDRGKGKSHFIRVLMELMSVRPRGLSFLKRAQCPILIDSDCTQGEGRFEMLEGFFPNRDAEQLQELHQFYQTGERNVAFKRAILLCHHKQVAYYKQILAPYVERGLCILPLALGVPDLGGFAFEVMLEWAVGGDDDAVYKNLIYSLVARHGEELKLGVLVQAVEKSGLRGHTKQTVLELFRLLFDYYTETESVMQHVGEYPVFTLVRGRYLPRNFVNPMQATLFNAFCRSTANGDPPRMVIFEEYAKALARNRAMQRFAMNFAEEGRHRPVSATGGLQHLEGFARGLWGAADNHVVFGLSNPQDVEKAKEELYGMRHLKFIEMAAHNMPRGRAWIFSRRGSVQELAEGLLVDIRPTLIRAGGQTLNAEDWESGR